jgi:F-type H+-transporting ATPase subunit b
MADDELEDRMVKVFAYRARNMEPEQLDRLTDALRSGPATVTVKSAFSLSHDQRARIEEAVRPCVGAGVPISFEVQDAQTAGIEMMTHGYKLSWSIGDYLGSLEENFVAALKEEIRLDEQAL